MTKQTEALKLALEALNSFPAKHLTPFISSARTAIREALASEAIEQPTQTDWEAVAADQALTIALLRADQQAEQTKKYLIGGLTLEYVFKPTGLENLSNLQAVLDQMEKALTQHPPQPSKPLTPDMFWNQDDAETPHDSIEEFLNDEICNGYLEVGAVFTLLQAKRFPSVKIRVTSIDENECEAEYEIIEGATNDL